MTSGKGKSFYLADMGLHIGENLIYSSHLKNQNLGKHFFYFI